MPDLAAQVAARYRGASRTARGFIAGKLRRDPAAPALLALGAARGFGDVLDLGCGRGQLGIALLLSGAAGSLHGIDIDARKIALAREAAQGLPARFDAADLAIAALPPPTPCCSSTCCCNCSQRRRMRCSRALWGQHRRVS